jgi:NADPH:quinone reductase-like Zn-dependent oxidoreductase
VSTKRNMLGADLEDQDAEVAGPTMTAVERDTYGSADLLSVRTVERPNAAGGDVLVEVSAAGVDRGVWHVMTGRPYLMRIAGFGLRRPKNPGLGSELAGVVAAVGADVTGVAPGDAVFGVGRSAFAEYALARAGKLARMPANLTYVQAAAVPVSGLTALQALRDKGRIQAGQSVLIIGASGGVGTFAVQIAKAFGATVTGVCSTAKIDLVRSLGADHVIDYTAEDISEGNRRYDLVLDIGGNRSLRTLRRMLTPTGTLVIIGGEGGGRWFGIGRQLRAIVLSPFVRQRLGTLIASENSNDLDALRTMIEDGVVIPVIDRACSLPEVPDAIRDLEGGRVRGKIVVAVNVRGRSD